MASIAELYAEQGRRQADHRRRQGESSAQLWGNLANIASSTISSIAQQREEAPRRQMADEAARLELDAARAGQAAARQGAEDKAIMQSALSADLDPDAIEDQLKQLGRGDLAVSFRRSWNDSEAAATTLKKLRADLQAVETDYWGALAAGVKPYLGEQDGGLSAVKMALSKAKRDGYEDADQWLEQVTADPSQLPKMIDGLLQASPAQRKMLGEEAERGLKVKQEERALTAAQQAEADRQADNARQAAADAEAARHNRAMEAKPAAGPQPGWQWVLRNGEEVYTNSVQSGDKPQNVRVKPTEDEKKTAGFYVQLKDAIGVIDELEDTVSQQELYQIQTLPQEKLLGMVNRNQLSEAAKRYLRAFEQFTESRLRPVSGAAISDGEYARDRRTYAKQFGETPKLKEDRQRARLLVLDSLKKRAGASLDDSETTPSSAPAPGVRQRVIGPNGETGTVPAGTSLPAGWRLQ